MVRLMGPSKATLARDPGGRCGESRRHRASSNVDQAGSRVYMGQTELRAGEEDEPVRRWSGPHECPIGGFRVRVFAGRDVHQGARRALALDGSSGFGGRRTFFSGASAGHRISYEVSGGARVLVRDLWYEGGAGAGLAHVHDRAVFTIDGARIASPANGTPPAFDIRDLNGRVAILSTDLDDRIVVSGDGCQAAVLALGVMAERRSSNYFLNAAKPAARAALVNSRQLSILPGVRSGRTTNAGDADAAFIRTMLSHTRGETVAPLAALPAGITDVRFFRGGSRMA